MCVRRRRFTIAVGSLFGLAGCSESDPQDNEDVGGQSNNTPQTRTTEPTDRTEPEPSQQTQTERTATIEQSETATDSPTPTAEEVAYQVRIRYEGEWQGSISAGGSSRSIDGSGDQTIEITGDPFIVSANAQKQDSTEDKLTIQILQDGAVIAEQSTTSSYGLAQVTSEDDENIGSGSESAETASSSFSIKVIYKGDWQGSITADSSSRSVDGSGDQTISIEGSPDIISANAQKNDDSSGELTIQIIRDGEVIAEASTTASYGVAQVSESFF